MTAGTDPPRAQGGCLARLTVLAGVIFVLAFTMWFTALNAGQRVTIRLGVVTLYGVPFTVLVFASLVLGMVVMLVAGIGSDLRVRRILRDRLAAEDREERARIFVDRSQQDLFGGGPVSAREIAGESVRAEIDGDEEKEVS